LPDLVLHCILVGDCKPVWGENGHRCICSGTKLLSVWFAEQHSAVGNASCQILCCSTLVLGDCKPVWRAKVHRCICSGTAQNNARRLLLRQELNSLKKAPTESIADFVARAKELATNLEAVGHKPEYSEVSLSVLAGLPQEYKVLVTVLGILKQTQTLDELLPSMLQMEQQIRADEQETVPMYGARDGMRSKQQRQNQQRNSRSDRPRFQGSCHYSGKKGRMASECRTRKKDQQGIRTVAYGASAVGAPSDDWIIDSGASKHLTPHKQHLGNCRSIAPNSAVTFVNGHQAPAVGQGEVTLRVQTASGCTDVTLQAVLHVPEATVNLFSTRQAMNTGAQVTFRDNRCFVSSHNTVIMKGVSQRDGTMVIRQNRQQPTYALAATTAAKQSPELWHRRIGHLGYDNLFKLKNKHRVESTSVPAEAFKEQQQQKPFCEDCTLAKQHRLPFPDSGSSSSALLELVPKDVYGPLQVKSTGEARYLATFIGDYSRLCHVVPLGYKSEVAQTIRATINLGEIQTGKRVKAIRTDRGTEYVSSELETYFSEKGVIHNTAAPYTPEQNRVAERFNCTLMERGEGHAV